MYFLTFVEMKYTSSILLSLKINTSVLKVHFKSYGFQKKCINFESIYSKYTSELDNKYTIFESLLPSIVIIGVSPPPQKHHPSLSCQAPPLNQQTVQAPLFRQSLLYIGFSWPPPPTKSWIFQWTPKILKFSILNTILSFKSN